MATPAERLREIARAYAPQILDGQDIYAAQTEVEACMMRNDLRKFVRGSWNVFEPKPIVWNWHLDAICDHLAYVSMGEIRNLMINIPPRMTKSLGTNVAWPVWDWISTPGRQFLCSSYAHGLALRDASKARLLIRSEWFQERYGHCFYIDPNNDKKEAYYNNHNGYRMSISILGKTTGEGGDIQIIDDPHNMSDVYSDTKRNAVLFWHDNSWRSRMNDPTKSQKVYIGQRSHDSDLFGHVLEKEADRWEVLSLPMEFDKKRPRCVTYFNKGTGPKKEEGPIFEEPRKKQGELLNPKRFGKNEVAAERGTDGKPGAMTPRDYSAQYQQDPTSGGGLIFKKKWWRQWVYPEDHPNAYQELPMPDFDMVISCYDTAFEKDEEADFSARTTWGLFRHAEPNRKPEVHALLLDCWADQVEFDDLKTEVKDSNVIWQEDWILIEKKASGHSLLQELRRSGITPTGVPKNVDKIFAAHLVQEVLKGGRVWYVPRDWAYQALTQAAKFPVGKHDDIVDTLIMAWAFMRRLSLIGVPTDEEEDEMRLFDPVPRKFYAA